jgi:hypothetical protein
MPGNADSSKDTSGRLYLPTLADLLDRLSVTQIKEVLLPEQSAIYTEEIRRLEHDIDRIINEKGLQLSAQLVRMAMVLAQMNLHIWHLKDRMQAEPERYSEHLNLAHQLNGIRNRMRNLILEFSGEGTQATRSTNVSTDGLQVDISI